MVSGLEGRDYESRLLELGMVTLEERRHQIDMVQTYKILHGKDKVRREEWFTMASESERPTRLNADPWNLRIPAPRLELRRSFFSQRVPALWNRVPAEIKASRTATAFKNAYRSHRRDQMAAAQAARG
jgi:hypothetical protein